MAELEFEKAFKYPFNRFKGMFNILWILLPIIGWFALFGYKIRIVKEWISNDFKELPKFDFGGDLKLGFFMFLKFIPLFLAIAVANILFSLAGDLGTLVFSIGALLIVPMLVVNFYKEETIAASFDFDKVKPVFDNFGDYIVALLKEIALQIIFLVLILALLLGIPGGVFTKNIFMADFYRRNVM